MTPWITKPVPFNIGLTPAAAGGGSGFDLDKLVAYYKFDNTTGTTLENKALAIGSSDSNGVDFTNNSGVTEGETGLIDYGYDYVLSDGQSYDGGASTDWEFMYNTTSGVFSFVGWSKPNTTGNGNRYVWENSDAENGTGTGLSITSNRLNWFLSKSDNTDDTIRMPIGSYPDTTDWRMIFVSWDSSDGSVQMSVNDGTKTTGTTTMTGNSGTSDTRMNFGSARATPILMLNAICDEWSFFNRVLSDAEVTTLYGDPPGSGFAL